VGVVEVGDNFDLVQEALVAQCGRQVRTQHFDGHLAIVLDVPGQVDAGHTPLPQLPLNPVAACQHGS
jgi:hypothetical protein